MSSDFQAGVKRTLPSSDLYTPFPYSIFSVLPECCDILQCHLYAAAAAATASTGSDHFNIHLYIESHFILTLFKFIPSRCMASAVELVREANRMFSAASLFLDFCKTQTKVANDRSLKRRRFMRAICIEPFVDSRETLVSEEHIRY
jgi:hypothetical protein